MIAGGVGIVLGLIVLFFGMALLEQERKDKKKQTKQKESQIAESDGQDLVNALVDGEEQPAFVNIRRVKLGAFMVAQGVLLAIVGIAFVLVCRFYIDIKWYITVPVIIIILILSFMTDAYMMGGFGLGETPTDLQAEGEESASTAQDTASDDAKEVEDCTDNSPVPSGEDSEE